MVSPSNFQKLKGKMTGDLQNLVVGNIEIGIPFLFYGKKTRMEKHGFRCRFSLEYLESSDPLNLPSNFTVCYGSHGFFSSMIYIPPRKTRCKLIVITREHPHVCWLYIPILYLNISPYVLFWLYKSYVKSNEMTMFQPPSIHITISHDGSMVLLYMVTFTINIPQLC